MKKKSDNVLITCKGKRLGKKCTTKQWVSKGSHCADKSMCSRCMGARYTGFGLLPESTSIAKG